MCGNVGLLARLELRHARSDLRFLLFAAGADIDEDRGFLERTYQLYLAVLFALALVLSWAQVIDLVEGIHDALGALAGSVAFALLAYLPAVLLVCWAIAGLQETPLRLTLPDISWLAREVRPEEILAVRLVRIVALWLFAGALGGHVLGVLAGAYEPLAWAAFFAVLTLTTRLAALACALVRSAARRRLRLPVTIAAGIAAVLLAVLMALVTPTLAFLMGLLFVPPALVADVLFVAFSLVLAAHANMAFVVDDNELYATRKSLSFLAFVNAGTYKEACRRRRFARRRKARRTWRFARGGAAHVSHALLSLVRRPSLLFGALTWGGALVPSGALLIAEGANVGVLLVWLLSVALALREPLPLAHVFREDCANRLVRPLLPQGALSLLLLDSLPLLVASLVSSALVLAALTDVLGTNMVPSVLLAWAMLLTLVFAAAFDDPQRVRSVGSFQLTAFARGVVCVFVFGLVGLLGVIPALVCAVVADALLAWSLR